MSIKYKAEAGESLAVVGNIEELGTWKDFSKIKLIRDESDKELWVAEDIILSA